METRSSNVRLTLPAYYYTDEAFFQREVTNLYMGSWLVVGREDQIPKVGDYFLRQLLNESIIILRAQDQSPKAFYNVCRHRGTRLCEKAVGSFSNSIQCPYHAWAYSLSGKLVGAPQMDSIPGFCHEDFSLQSIRCETWDGHLFVTLNANPPVSLKEHLGELSTKFRRWQMEELRLGHRIVYDVKANWKLIVQNYSECLHCPFIHPVLQRLSHFLSGRNVPSKPTYLGGEMALREGVETLSMDGKRRRSCLPTLSEKEQRSVEYYWISPNLLLSLHPDFVLTHTLWPKQCGQTEVICEWHFHRDEISSPGFVLDDVVEFWDVTNRQDWHVSELSQAGIASRAYRPGPYSNREGLLYDFDRIIEGAANIGGYSPLR